MKVLCVLLATAAACFGQGPGEFRGIVVDPVRNPVAGASVHLAGETGEGTVTGADGRFSLTRMAGSHTVVISHEGFSDLQAPVDFPGGETEFRLELAPVRGMMTISESDRYVVGAIRSATKTPTALIDLPQSVTVIGAQQIKDQMMMSVADVVRYVPGVTSHQGENNRDQLVIRGNNSSADFFVDGVRDDVQYFRDLYNLERVEALKGPNALAFGRGGAGGVINRVTKEAGGRLREVSLQGGSFGNRRVSADFSQPVGKRVAVRLNSMFEDSGSFRDYVSLRRFGFSPAVSIQAGANTRVTLNHEFFRDDRTADRGVPSYLGRPIDVAPNVFFGNPDQSKVRARVVLGAGAVEHQAGALNLRNRIHFADYDRGYDNFVPGVVTPARDFYSLSGYNNATQRRNIFNQTDVSRMFQTGRISHSLTGGTEVGRQMTDNLRQTAYFDNSFTAISIPVGNPVTRRTATFRPNATDANNHVTTLLGAVYMQDQADITRKIRLTGGVRFDHFDLRYLNNRNGDVLRRIDRFVSPRAGIVVKPVDRLSLYGSYSVSFLPSAGDQFSSLTTVTQQVKPERFTNYEGGFKWDAGRSLFVTGALYRLDRTNTRSTDPNDPTRIVQTGSQRTNGMEAGIGGSVTRRWRISGGFSLQDAFVTSATVAARPGAQVAMVPHRSFSLWNNFDVYRRVGAGIGIINRSDMFAAIDNAVVLPGYTRVDAALFVPLREGIRLQVNAENVGGVRYFANADNNNNISPGSPRAVRVGLTARF